MSNSIFGLGTDDKRGDDKDRYPTLSLPDLLDGPTEVDWLVEPIIPPSASVLLAGSSGVGKTWLSLDMALSVATGKDWLGQFKVRQGPVLVVDEENSPLLLRVRLKMLLGARGIRGGDLPIRFLVGAGINLSPVKSKSGALTPTNSYKMLLTTVEKVKPSLVILDSLTRVHRANENNAGEVAAVFAGIKTLMRETGASTLSVHHFRKGGASKSRSGDRIRGSSDIRAFVDATLLVDEQEGGCVITHDKSRWSIPIKPFAVEFASDDGFSITYAGEVEAAEKGKTAKQKAWAYIKDTLSDGAKDRQDLIAGLDGACSVRTLEDVLSWGCEVGRLDKWKEGRPVFYALADSDEVIEQREGNPFPK
jgi:hypothetical protein